MTLDDIRASSRIYLSPADIAPILQCDPHSIRVQAHQDPSALGYPVIVIGRRIRIPRVPFIQYLGGDIHG